MAKRKGTAREVFFAFLRLGLTAFGGPVAHIGYFRDEFVGRRKWLDEKAFGDLVALCQFLPGPASSQVGFALGLRRAGALGAMAAWCGFTLPSALLMAAFAYGAGRLSAPWAAGVLHGLKLVAVAVVAQAVVGMARSLTPDLRRAVIASLAFAAISLVAASAVQVAVIAGGAVAGLWLCRDEDGANAGDVAPVAVAHRVGVASLASFIVLLVGLPVVAAVSGNGWVARFDAFYRSGALVFGGGHVVLPLLKQAVVAPGWVSEDRFLAGYGAAQAMPGPLFTFAAYLGAVMNGVAGAIVGLVGIFLPGMLALVAALPFWARVQGIAGARAAMRGANAAVVGILAAAFVNPVWTGTVRGPMDIVVAAAGFGLLVGLKWPPVVVVVLGAVAGAVMH